MAEYRQNSPNIREIYKGKCILVTGATGFLGKVLVEKLLRSCPGIEEIMVLMRPSKTKTVEERIQDLLENPVFDRLRREKPESLFALRPLTGDIAKDNLGLCHWQLQKVVSEVSFVFHCAANVRFDEEPRKTFTANLLGVKNVLQVCKLCKNLEAFVHVSTAFSFCNQVEISEKLYPESVNPDNILDVLEFMTNDQFNTLCSRFCHGRPSLYQFSKALAEIYVTRTASAFSIPAIIVRPSIVTAAVSEPFPGWIDNYNGPSGFIAVCGKSIVKTLLVQPTVNADWVPVDIVANTLIVAAHYVAVKSNLKDELKLMENTSVPIINCTCPKSNLITWMEIVQLCLPFLKQYPSAEVYGYPGGTVTPHLMIYFMRRMVSHYLPALMMDVASVIIGKKAKFISMYRNIHRVMGHLEHYTTHSFTFDSLNMRILVQHMDTEDKRTFCIDQSTLNWTQYIENYVLGVRRYFLREKDETIPEARLKMRRIHYIWLAMKVFSLIAFLYMISPLKQHGSKYIKGSPDYTFFFPVRPAMTFLYRKFNMFTGH